MAEYILTGRNRRGRTVTDIVDAESADEAVRFFSDDGHSDVILHTDDNVAPFHTPSKHRKTFTPREFLGYRTRGRVGCMLFLIRKLYTQSWFIYVFFAAVIAYHRWLGADWGLFDSIPMAFLFFPILFAIYSELMSKAVPYRRMLKAVLHARWEEVPRHLRRVRMPLPPFERPFREAQVLAGLGRLDEALDHFRPVLDEPTMPPHLYWTYKAMIYQTAKERVQALECVTCAAALAPNNAVCHIDLALALLVVKNDVRQARERLAIARQHAMSDVSTPLYWFADGVLALKEKRPADAVALLKSALAGLTPFTGGNPAIWTIIARINAYLALAHAANGDHEAAVQAYKKAEPILAAHDALELARCREVLG